MYTDLILTQGILMILSSLSKYVHVIQVSLQYSQEREPEKENEKCCRDGGRGERVGSRQEPETQTQRHSGSDRDFKRC